MSVRVAGLVKVSSRLEVILVMVLGGLTVMEIAMAWASGARATRGDRARVRGGLALMGGVAAS